MQIHEEIKRPVKQNQKEVAKSKVERQRGWADAPPSSIYTHWFWDEDTVWGCFEVPKVLPKRTEITGTSR